MPWSDFPFSQGLWETKDWDEVVLSFWSIYWTSKHLAVLGMSASKPDDVLLWLPFPTLLNLAGSPDVFSWKMNILYLPGEQRKYCCCVRSWSGKIVVTRAYYRPLSPRDIGRSRTTSACVSSEVVYLWLIWCCKFDSPQNSLQHFRASLRNCSKIYHFILLETNLIEPYQAIHQFGHFIALHTVSKPFRKNIRKMAKRSEFATARHVRQLLPQSNIHGCHLQSIILLLLVFLLL